MKYFKLAAAAVIFAALTGCKTTTKAPVPYGGSKADGLVTLVYSVHKFESVNVDWPAADVSALRRCKAWGYQAAERFGVGGDKCVDYNLTYGCMTREVRVNYQCTD